MLDLFSKAVELAADRTGELAMLCGKLQGLWCFQLSFGRVAFKLIELLLEVSSILLNPLKLYIYSLAFSAFFQIRNK